MVNQVRQEEIGEIERGERELKTILGEPTARERPRRPRWQPLVLPDKSNDEHIQSIGATNLIDVIQPLQDVK